MIDKELWHQRVKQMLDQVMRERTADLQGFLVIRIDQDGSYQTDVVPAGPPEFREMLSQALREQLKLQDAAGYVVIFEAWIKLTKTTGKSKEELFRLTEEQRGRSLRQDPEREDAFITLVGDEDGTLPKIYRIKPGSRRLRELTEGPTENLGSRFIDLMKPPPTTH